MDNDYTRKTQPPDGQTTIIAGISGTGITYLPGDIVDGTYKLTKLLGRGGMGAVFSCEHMTLNKEYAIKILSADNLSGEAWSRFQQEAQTLARLNHPGIVGIHNMGIDKEQCPYYVMDLLPGETLDQKIRARGRLSVNRALDIFIHVADALGSAHSQGIVHRDIKPSNLMLVSDPLSKRTVLKIVDFGIARVQKQNAAGQSQTATGMIFGTPFYMSPEQCDGSRADERSDVYSFGCSLFEALTGRPPFVGESAFQTFMMHQTQPPPTLAEVAEDDTFPKALETAVQKMLQKKREARYQSMSQVRHDLERIRAGKPIMGQTDATLTPVPAAKPYKGRVQNVDDPDEDDAKNKNNKPAYAIMAAAAAIVLITAGLGAYFMITGSTKKSGLKNIPSPPTTSKINATLDTRTKANFELHNKFADMVDEKEERAAAKSRKRDGLYVTLKGYGATEAETALMNTQTKAKVGAERLEFEEKLWALINDPKWMAQKFKSNGVFHFPKDFILGHISIDGKPPVNACGDISEGANKSAVFYFLTPNRPYPQLLQKFGPDDLTGVSMVFDQAGTTIDTLAKWHRLEEVDFFNLIIKSNPDSTEDWDESEMADADLSALNRLTSVKALGLCLPVTAGAIKNLALVRRINCLKLKRVNGLETLLKELRYYNNLTELWLVHEDTQDYQLGYLANMKNLKKLVIRRSRLTPKCFLQFSQIPQLRYLRLDRNDWTKEQKDNLKKLMPNCVIEYEPVAETKYWDMFPKGHQYTPSGDTGFGF